MTRAVVMGKIGCLMRSGDKQKVVVSGAGVAGIEAALALRELAGERLDVEVWDPRGEFVYRPFAVAEPYGSSRSFRYEMDELVARCGARFCQGSIASVNPKRQIALTRDGQQVAYDHLVIAGGVRMLWAVPGAATFWGVTDEGSVGETIARLRAGELRSIAFTMPAGRGWALPLYELALLGSAEIAKAGYNTRIAIVTPEEGPLDAFGRGVVEGMEGLLGERGIELVTGTHPIEFEDGRLRVAPGEPVEAEAAISLPRLEGRRVGGIPHDADGFVVVDERCRVRGLDRVYAAGDVTAFPIKQGGLASQQADAVAEAIAVEVGALSEARPFDPILRAVLWTGEGPRYLYGRPTGGHGEASSFSERPKGPLRSGKVVARHFSPLVDELEAEQGARGLDDRPESRRASSG